MKEVTAVLTANNRLPLLERTLTSFNLFNTYPIKELLIRDDSGDKEVCARTSELLCHLPLPFPFRLFDSGKVGQIKSCEIMYRAVTTPYVFHLEEDWEFCAPMFIEACFQNLEEGVHSVWVRNEDDFDGFHRVKPHTDEKFVVPNTISHGFSFNPHLFDMQYYDGMDKTGGATPEDSLGLHYLNRGLKTVWIPGYCYHIG